MLSPQERLEIQEEVHRELAQIESAIAHQAGSYDYYCSLAGMAFFSHRPIGQVIRHIDHRQIL